MRDRRPLRTIGDAFVINPYGVRGVLDGEILPSVAAPAGLHFISKIIEIVSSRVWAWAGKECALLVIHGEADNVTNRIAGRLMNEQEPVVLGQGVVPAPGKGEAHRRCRLWHVEDPALASEFFGPGRIRDAEDDP